VDSELNHDETEKVTYKILQQASYKMASETPVEQTPVEQPQETESPTDEKQEMSREEMMQVIIEQQRALDSKSDEQKELEEYKAKIQKQQETEAAQEQEKARNLSQALVDQWAATLDKSTMNDANKESIMKMARDFPKESMEMLRVAHLASKAHAAQIQKFEEFKQMTEKLQLQERFEAVMQKKRPREVEPVQVVHAASVKKPKKSSENAALSIIKQYRASGSARDHMSAIHDYQAPRRRVNRQPYY
jgi:hypothetical protein